LDMTGRLVPLRTQATELERLVGRNVRRRREALGWSQTDLADKLRALGIVPGGQASVAALETGKRRPRLLDLAACCAALGCSMADLLEGADAADRWQAEALAGVWKPDPAEQARLDAETRRLAEEREDQALAVTLLAHLSRQGWTGDQDADDLRTLVRQRYGRSLRELRDEAAERTTFEDQTRAKQYATRDLMARVSWELTHEQA
jgi:transcriptional regulator with XRE-family HTH domain